MHKETIHIHSNIMRPRFIWFLLTLLSLPAPLAAQDTKLSTIVGTITSHNGESLPGSQILLSGSELGTVADFEGRFVLKNIPFGRHTLVASYLGHENQEKVVEVSQSTLSVDFQLPPDMEVLEEVLVTHDAMEQVRENGYAVDVISTKPLQTQSIQLNRVLDQISGIRVRQSGGLGSKASVTVNGLSGKAVRFFMDGIPMDYFGSSYSINTIPVSLIDRIEVYKGVVPVELGNDALGGAVNLVSKPNLDNSVEVSYSYGSFNTHRASVVGNWRDKASGFTTRINSFYNYSDNNYKVWGDDIYYTNPETYRIERFTAERFHDSFESKAIKADVGFSETPWADQLFAGVLLSDMDKDIQHGATMEVPFGEATYSQSVIMPYATYQKQGLLNQNLDVNVFASYSRLDMSRVDTSKYRYDWRGIIYDTTTLGGEQVRTLNNLKEDAFLTRINLAYHLGRNHSIGYNYVFSDLTRKDNDPIYNTANNTDGYFAPQLFSKHSMGLTLQSLWLEEKLRTTLFVKYFSFSATVKTTDYTGDTPEFSRATDSSPGYGIAGSFVLNPKWTITSSIESAVRLPEPNEILGDALFDDSNPDLRAEKSLNANMGFEYKPMQNRIHNLTLYTNVFYRQVQGLIQKDNFDNPDQFKYQNVDSVTMTGIDGEIRYKFKGFMTLSQTLSYLHPVVTSATDAYGRINIKNGTRLPNTPFFQSNTNLFFNFNDVIQSGSRVFSYLNHSFVGEYHRRPENLGQFNKEIIPAQSVVSCGVGYTFPKETLSVSVDFSNIFNEQVFDNYALQKPGRAIYGKLTYRIM